MTTGTPTTIEVNGFAFREIRVRSGMDIAPTAAAIGISRPYLAHLELGQRVRVRPPVFLAMLRVLQIKDRRALLADPHGPAVEIEDLDEAESSPA